eukprot:9863120-Alexandrium_andersonii.AAC.1
MANLLWPVRVLGRAAQGDFKASKVDWFPPSDHFKNRPKLSRTPMNSVRSLSKSSSHLQIVGKLKWQKRPPRARGCSSCA